MSFSRCFQTCFAMLMLALLPGLALAGDEPRLFLSAQDVQKLMQDPALHVVVAEVGWGGPQDYYDKGHVPGAIHVNTDEIEYDEFHKRSATPANKLGRSTTAREDAVKGLGPDSELPRNWWNVYPDQYLFPTFADMGINLTTTVVLYGKDQSAAARMAWALLYAGVQDVHLLDGGLAGWKKAGFDVSTTPTERTPVAAFGTDKALHPEYLATVAYVRDVAFGKLPDALVADIRTKPEYTGESAPYSYIPTKGRVKGAVWGHAGNGPWTMDYYVNGDGWFKPVDEVRDMWAKSGITADKDVSFYCGTGWRSSLAFLFAYQMGWPHIHNFDSGWYEWSMGPQADSNPITK